MKRYRLDKLELEKDEEYQRVVNTYGYPIGEWDVSKVEDFTDIFGVKDAEEEICPLYACRTKKRVSEKPICKFNEDISKWNVSNGRYFSRMFQNAFFLIKIYQTGMCQKVNIFIECFKVQLPSIKIYQNGTFHMEQTLLTCLREQNYSMET